MTASLDSLQWSTTTRSLKKLKSSRPPRPRGDASSSYALVAWSLCTQNIYDCYKCSEHIQKIEGVFTLVFDPPEINGGIDCGFLCPATDGPPVPSFADDQDEDEPEDQSEDQDADADEPEDQDEHED